ncbi:hypothetical protein CDD82_7098 [Ophiocordyceps australis]|uniref:Uncharacterized protein n=1 Tax=Ophiocordyceps australis TaxID=1399860 RepID=A0A2C5XFF0_9HYPO|nr:hypothetical protein CDD82_7098 [Ophiocordyceps australis]
MASPQRRRRASGDGLHGHQSCEMAGASSQPSTLYTIVATPIVFVSFLVSLAIVDAGFSLRRLHRPPAGWLRALVLRPHRDGSCVKGDHPNDNLHYHSYQRKLLEMEAAHAFEIRSAVVVLLLALVVLVFMAFCYSAAWLRRVMPWKTS